MQDLLKKALYTSVGFLNMATEKMEETVSDLVERGKLSEDEGKKVVDDLMSDLESRRETFEGRINGLVSKIVSTVDVPNRSDFATLKSRIKELEAQLEGGETATSVRKVVKKAVRKKAVAKETTPGQEVVETVRKKAVRKKAVAKKTIPSQAEEVKTEEKIHTEEGEK